jgi:hypothetical protein
MIENSFGHREHRGLREKSMIALAENAGTLRIATMANRIVFPSIPAS